MRDGRRRLGGFTFVELVVIVSFVGILAALGVYAFQGVRNAPRSTACATDERTVRNAETTYFNRHGFYADEQGLVGDGLLAAVSGLHQVITSGTVYTVISSGPCATRLLSDGFEPPSVDPAGGGSYQRSSPSSFGAWTIASGSITVVSNSKWHLPVGGAQSVELSGKGYGAIRRTVSGLVPGNTYTLRFAYADNTCAPSAGIRVQIGDLDTTVNATKKVTDGFQIATTSFVARRSAEILTFTGSGRKPACGALIDDILVTT